jgi:demethylmenaquinone methyltransferase/2-methoxy-6-polyprenyl-1,4-benzoquinol methylase
VIGVDAAAAPLHLAEARQQRQPWLPVRFQQDDALETGLLSGSADGLVMAYGLRNLADPARGLEEMRRVLKRGGRAAVLDFNRLLPGTAAAQFQRLYLRRLVVPIAASVGLKDEYAYLEESLQRFPMGHEQEDLARRAGFSEVQHQPMVGGQMGCLMLRA